MGKEECARIYRAGYSFVRYHGCDEPTAEDSIGMYSAALLLNWTVGRAANALKRGASLYEGEAWYMGSGPEGMSISNRISNAGQRVILEPLRDLEYGPRFVDILPYAAEVFETSDEILKGLGSSRKSKRAGGVFYTPSDVSDYMVDFVLSIHPAYQSGKRLLTWLDPACGTGSFLLSALYRIAERYRLRNGEEALDYVTRCLHGIDISPVALQSAAYVLAIACSGEGLLNRVPLRSVIQRVGRGLAVCDATSIKCRSALGKLFPSLGHSGADLVVSNPPYTRRDGEFAHSQSGFFFARHSSRKRSMKEVYAEFVPMMCSLSNEINGAGAMIVPLSITYSQRAEFGRLRDLIWSSGRWWLANFDRTPDSLFGDDVKTRNTILFLSQQQHYETAVHTTDLIRWSSRSRTGLFDSVQFSRISPALGVKALPKVGDDFGQELLVLILKTDMRNLGTSLEPLSGRHSGTQSLRLRSSSTAYNWLPFEMVTPGLPDEEAHTQGKYTHWLSKVEEDAPAVFALLESRIAYWLWRVWGDGFHLTNRFVSSLPLSPTGFANDALNRLRVLGLTLWEEMSQNPIISSNAGRTLVSYCPYLSDSILDQIDYLVIRRLHLPSDTLKYVKSFVQRTVIAGREDEIDSNPALRKWMEKERKHACRNAGDQGKKQADEGGVERVHEDGLAYSQCE
jgi:Eco57I restriction-modification methylase